jgi:hypothetical protein
MRDGPLGGHSPSTANELESMHNSAGINVAGTFCVKLLRGQPLPLRMSIGRSRPNKVSPWMSLQLSDCVAKVVRSEPIFWVSRF